ncbi:MAG: hypothetical protein AAGK26_00200, partial [Pseudomonadota bacterium]
MSVHVDFLIVENPAPQQDFGCAENSFAKGPQGLGTSWVLGCENALLDPGLMRPECFTKGGIVCIALIAHDLQLVRRCGSLST